MSATLNHKDSDIMYTLQCPQCEGEIPVTREASHKPIIGAEGIHECEGCKTKLHFVVTDYCVFEIIGIIKDPAEQDEEDET